MNNKTPLFDKINMENLLSCSGGFHGDKEAAKEYILERIAFLDSIDDIELYRVVFIDNIDSLDTNKLGKHWTPDLYNLDDSFLDYLQYECNGEKINGTPFIIKTKYNRNSIDLVQTLYQNVLNPDENELFIDNKNDYISDLEFKKYGDKSFNKLDKSNKKSATSFLAMKTEKKYQWQDIYSISEEIYTPIKEYIKNNFNENFTMSCYDESIKWGNKIKIMFPSSDILLFHGMYNDEGHTWLEIDGHIFDPTASQFDNFPNMDDFFYDEHESEDIELELSDLLPTTSFNKLYHTGTMDINNKKQYNLEGINGLSVSNLDNIWNKICDYTHGNDYTLINGNNKFLDFHELNSDTYQMILDWGVENEYLEKCEIFRHTYFDDELDSEVFIDFNSKDKALLECDEFDLTSYHGHRSTQKFINFNGVSNKDNIELISVIYVENETNLDGVFWNDKLDIDKYSAPRAIILQNKLKNWNITMKKPNIDFYNDNIKTCIDQYENLTFDQVHGELVEKEIKQNARVLDVGCGTGRDAHYLASTGRIVVAIDPSNEMIKFASENNSHENIQYLQSELPSLESVSGKFDFILMSAVWMHLDEDTQKESMAALSKLLKKNGKMMILIRNGGFSDGRISHPFMNDEFDDIKKELNLSSKLISGTKEDLLNRSNVSWSKLLITKCEKPKNTLKLN